MKNAMAVALSVLNSMTGCVVSDALSAQVNCVHPHQIIQNTRTAWAAAVQLSPWWSNPTT